MPAGLTKMSDRAERRQTRAIGPIGTAGRSAAGVLLIAVPIATHGIEAGDLAGALIVFPALSWGLNWLVFVAARRSAWLTHLDARAQTWFTNVAMLVLFLLVAVAATYVTPIDAGAIWLFFGLSMIVAALRGDAACEVLAIVNAGGGLRDDTGWVAGRPPPACRTGWLMALYPIGVGSAARFAR